MSGGRPPHATVEGPVAAYALAYARGELGDLGDVAPGCEPVSAIFSEIGLRATLGGVAELADDDCGVPLVLRHDLGLPIVMDRGFTRGVAASAVAIAHAPAPALR